MTDTWAHRLLAALNADPDLDTADLHVNNIDADDFDAAETASLGSNTDRPGPWDPPAGAVPNHVVVAALIGHPTTHDSDLILNNPTALRQLTEHWTRNPPSDALMEMARHNPRLSDLLTATGTIRRAARGTGLLSVGPRAESQPHRATPGSWLDRRPTAAQPTHNVPAKHADSGNGSGGTGSNHRRVRRLPLTHLRHVAVTLVAAAIVAMLATLGGSSVYLYVIDRNVTANIQRELDLPAEVTTGENRPAKAPDADQTLDYLLIGTDDGNPDHDENGRSDAIMLLHVNQARDKAYLISFPRTTMVTIPGQRQQQPINNAYALGGPSLVVHTLEKLTNTRVDHVALIDFGGFVNLTQDLDGVTVHNRYPFSSQGFTFPAGDITLSGPAALVFVRERRAFGPNGELQQAENQCNVLKAILTKGLSAEVISDPFHFTEFLGDAAKRIKVDKSLSNAELRATAASLRMKPSDLKLISAPLGKVRTAQGKRAYTIDQVRLAELSEALRTDTMAEYLKKYPQG